MNCSLELLCLLPLLVTLGSAYIVWKQTDKDLPQYLFIIMLLFGAAGYLLKSIAAIGAVWAECLSMVIVPMTFPLTIMFLNTLYYQTRLNWTVGFLFLPAVVFCSVASTINLLLYPEVGGWIATLTDNTFMLHPFGRAQLMVCGYAYPILLLAYGIALIRRSIFILKNTGFSTDAVECFLLKEEQLPVLHIFSFVLLCFFSILMLHIALGGMFPVLAACFTLFETGLIVIMGLAGRCMSQPGGCVLQDLRWNAQPRATLAEQYSYIDDNTQIDEELLNRFKLIQTLEVMMAKDKVFLNADLSIESLAASLCTNRLYLSRLINAEFGMNFRSFINDYRVEYSQQYMMAHPEVNQLDVAYACGFPSASTFNKKFKDVVGMTPKAWCVTKGLQTNNHNETEQPT